MSKNAIVWIVVVAAILVGGTIWIASRDGDDVNENETDGYVPEKIVAEHFYSNGTHSLSGEVTVPTPCHALSSRASVVAGSGDTKDQATLELTVTPSDEVCVQVLDEKLWSVTFEANEDAEIKATYNGKPVPIELVAQGEGIDKL